MKKLKIRLCILLAIIATAMCCYAITTAECLGTCGNGVNWQLSDGGVLTISGTGPMADYEDRLYVPWYNHRQAIVRVSIEDGVTRIGDFAFFECTNLTDISIPNSITTIGDQAFVYDSNLSNFEMPNNITSIGVAAFAYCSSLTSIPIEE